MKKMKTSTKVAVASTIVASSTVAMIYAVPTLTDSNSEDVTNKVRLAVEKIDSDTVRVALDNIKDIPKALQFSVKLEGAALNDGEKSITDLVSKEVKTRLENKTYATNNNGVLTDYTYNEKEKTIDVLITSEDSIPKTGNKIDVLELDVKAANASSKETASKYKVIPTPNEEYKYVTKNNKEVVATEIEYDKNEISMNEAPTIVKTDKIIEVEEGTNLELTAENLGLTIADTDGEKGLRLEIKEGDKVISNFNKTEPGIYEIKATAVDNFDEKSETIVIQVNVTMSKVTTAPEIKFNDDELKDITINSGEIFKPLENITAIDAKGRGVEVKFTVDKELNLNPEETTEYTIRYTATDIYGNTATKDVKLTVVANKAPIITGVKDQTINKGDDFDPKAGVTVEDEDKDIELVVTHDVNTGVPGKYKISYSATDKGGKTTRVQSTLTVNTPPIINVGDKSIIVGQSFDKMAGVTAIDEEDGDITERVTVSGDVNTSKEGEYALIYSVTDKDNATTTKKITVKVYDKLTEVGPSNPIIPVTPINNVPEIQAEDVELRVGDKFDPLKGVTATDKEDNDETLKIDVIENTVKTETAGTYSVTYKVTDGDGASITKTIKVVVKPRFSLINKAPQIIAKKEEVSIKVGENFEALAWVTAQDKEDGDITSKIEVAENTVDTSKAGDYIVTYSVTDSKGAKVTKKITVKVYDKLTEIEPSNPVKPEVILPEDITNEGGNATEEAPLICVTESVDSVVELIELAKKDFEVILEGKKAISDKTQEYSIRLEKKIIANSEKANKIYYLTIRVPKNDEFNNVFSKLEKDDKEAPTLDYSGELDITVENGDEFKVPTVTVTDNLDDNVTVDIVIKDGKNNIINNIDTTKAGVYTITYTAKDESGNISETLVINVIVKEAEINKPGDGSQGGSESKPEDGLGNKPQGGNNNGSSLPITGQKVAGLFTGIAALVSGAFIFKKKNDKK